MSSNRGSAFLAVVFIAVMLAIAAITFLLLEVPQGKQVKNGAPYVSVEASAVLGVPTVTSEAGRFSAVEDEIETYGFRTVIVSCDSSLVRVVVPSGVRVVMGDIVTLKRVVYLCSPVNQVSLLVVNSVEER